MDYEFFDDSRTRFQVQSGPFTSPLEAKNVNRKVAASCIGIAILALALASSQQSLSQFLLVWLALALLVGPFAPLSVTGGDCRVGVGKCLPDETQDEILETETSKKTSRQPRRTRNGESFEKMQSPENAEVWLQEKPILSIHENHENLATDVAGGESATKVGIDLPSSDRNDRMAEAEWTSEDIDLLRKQLAKHPRGKLKRWEVITEAFNGIHSVESVVRMSKALGEKRTGEDDSFSKFLAQRKESASRIASPLSQRWDLDGTLPENYGSDNQEKLKASDDYSEGDGLKMEEGKRRRDWTELEERALLTALKAFPKDTSMRWEKISAAVPGKTKAQCFRRFQELKDNFRNNKSDRSNKVLESDD